MLFDKISLFNDTQSQNYTIFYTRLQLKTMCVNKQWREKGKMRMKEKWRESIAEKGCGVARKFDRWSDSKELND